MNDIKINLPAGGVVTWQPTGIGGVEVTVTVPKPAEPVRTITLDMVSGLVPPAPAPAPAPAPPPQTEAERLVELARSLPEAVWKGCGWEDPQNTPEHDIRVFTNPGWHFFTDAQFPIILLGIMAAYVGTEVGAHVVIGRNGVVIWTSCLDDAFHDAPDLLTAYRDCCLAIARKRGGA